MKYVTSLSTLRGRKASLFPCNLEYLSISELQKKKDELQQSSFEHSSPINQAVGGSQLKIHFNSEFSKLLVLSVKLPLYFQVY